MSAPAKPSGIKPPTSRLARPSVTSKPSSNGSIGDTASVASSEDSLGRKKVSIDRTPLLDGDERDQVTDLPSLPGSRRTSEQARRLSDGSGNALDAAAYEMARRLSEAGVRRMSDANIVLTADTDSFIIGQRVFVNGTKPGVIQFIGETKFAPGDWAGIVLDDFTGKNNGTVGGHRYFQCEPKKGVFSRLTRLTRQPLSADQLAILAAQHSTENGDESIATSPVPPNLPAPTAASSPLGPPSAPSTMISVQSIGDLRLGDRVIVTSTQGSKAGTLRYLGQTEFAVGQWAGVELDEPLGKNDGAVAGTRYFECQAMYGLFAPIHKVSRSPANHMRRTSGSVMNASMTSSASNRLTRQGTRDSFGGASDRVSVASVATSRASTAVSRKPSRPSVGGSAHANLQEVLREKEQHIEQLMKEREMERSEVTRAASQADEAEIRLAVLQRKYNDDQSAFQAKIEQLERQLADAESARVAMAAQIDDLQFRLEEETIIRGDLEAEKVKGSDDKENEWARLSEQLEKEAQRCFEAEELAARYKDELDSLKDRRPDDERFGKLEDVVRAKDAEIGQLKDSVAELSRTLESEQLKRETVEGQFRAAEQDLESTRSSLTRAKDAGQHESREWHAKFESLERQLVETREQLAKSNDDKTRLESLLTDAKNALVRLRDAGQSESGQLVVKLQEAERVDYENKEKIAELLHDKEKLEFQLAESAVLLEKSNETNQELHDLKQKLINVELDSTQSKDQLVKLNEEKANLQAKLEELESNFAKIKETSEFEADELKAKIDDLEQQVNESKQERDKLAEEKVSLDKKLEDIEDSLLKSKQESEAQHSEWNLQSEEINRRMSSLNGEITSLQSQKQELESKLNDALSSLSQTQESSDFELNETKSKLHELEKKCDVSRDLITKAEEEKLKLESELFEARERIAHLEQTNQNESVKLNAISDELKLKCEESERKTLESKEMLAKFEAEKTQLAAEIEVTRNALREKEMAARAEIEENIKKLDELRLIAEASEKRGLELNEQLVKMNEEKAQLEEELRKQIEIDHEWKGRYDEQERQKVSSDQKIAQINDEKARLESEVLKLSSSSSDASQDLTRLHGELMAARQALAESQSTGALTEQARVALEQQLAAVRSDLQARDERINELSSQRSDLESQLQSAKKDLADIDAQLKKEREDREQLDAQFKLDIQSRDESIAHLSTTQTELETQLQVIQEQLNESQTRLDADTANWSKQVDDLKSALSKKDEEMKELASCRSILEAELDTVKRNLAEVESRYEAKREEADTSISSLKTNVEARQKEVADLTAVKNDLEAKLSELNNNLAANQVQFEREKAELDLLVSNLRSELIDSNKRIADLQSAADEYESELSVTKQENARNAQLLEALESNRQESMGSVADLQKAVAVLELEKANLLNEKAHLEDVVSQREAQFLSLSADKEETGKKLQERDEKLAQLVNEVNQLQTKFATHVAELEQKLEANKKAEQTERELQAALQEARARADDLQNALEEAKQSQQELFEAQEQLVTLSVAHEELNERVRIEKEESNRRIEELVAETETVRGRESKLRSELEALKHQVDEQNARLQSQLKETKQEADTVRQLLDDLEIAQKRVKELESTLATTNHEMHTKLDETSRKIKGLEEQLQIKTVELKEEMDDRDKAEDRCLKLAENLKVKDAEVDSLRQEVNILKKSSSDVSHLMTAFTTVDKEKKQLEAKVVELQVAAAAASRGAEAKETDTRIKHLKEENETLQREINFLNSVIVDMQKKVDDLKLKLEVSQATLLGQNIFDEHGMNGMKPKAVAPRLFCDICDMFDLHDTEDCPKQASCDIDDNPPPVLLNCDSPSYAQHSRHGGSRGTSRAYCENCEVFGHATKDCNETSTY